MRRRLAWSRAGLVLGAVLLADQASKAAVVDSVRPGTREAVFPGVELVHVRNEGVAFGVLAGGHALVVAVVSAALLGVVVYFATHAERPLIWLPAGLLMGGALGNLVDRLGDGGVTDFIKVPLWPAFNLADIAITTGVLSLLYVIEEGARRPDVG